MSITQLEILICGLTCCLYILLTLFLPLPVILKQPQVFVNISVGCRINYKQDLPIKYVLKGVIFPFTWKIHIESLSSVK